MKALPNYQVGFACGCHVVFHGKTHYYSSQMDCCPKHQRPRHQRQRDAIYLRAYDEMRAAVRSVAQSN